MYCLLHHRLSSNCASPAGVEQTLRIGAPDVAWRTYPDPDRQEAIAERVCDSLQCCAAVARDIQTTVSTCLVQCCSLSRRIRPRCAASSGSCVTATRVTTAFAVCSRQ